MEESQEADVRCVRLVASRIGEGLQLEERGSVNVCGDGGFRGGAKSLWRSGGVLCWVGIVFAGVDVSAIPWRIVRKDQGLFSGQAVNCGWDNHEGKKQVAMPATSA